MYTIYVFFKCIDGKREDFVKRVREEGILDEVLKEDGCIRYDYYFSEKDPNEILLLEAWVSKDHQQAHIQTPHMARLREIKGDYVISTTLGEYEVK